MISPHRSAFINMGPKIRKSERSSCMGRSRGGMTTKFMFLSMPIMEVAARQLPTAEFGSMLVAR